MRSLVICLLALLFASPASAVRIVVWRAAGTSNANQEGVSKYEGAVREVLNDLGVDFDMLPQDVARTCPTCPAANRWSGTGSTAPLKNGVVTFADGTTRTYGGQIFLGWRSDAIANSLAMPRFNPDTVTLAANWPAIPSAFLGISSVLSGSMYNSTATCTTGVRATTSISPMTLLPFETSEYLVGSPLVWKNGNISYYRRDAGALTLDFAGTPGVLRSRVAIASAAPAYRTNGLSSCTDCDSIPRAANQWSAPADTSIIWTRQRDVNDKSWLIFAPGIYVGNGGPDLPSMSISKVIALMDSATGGKVIGQVPGWEPKKIAFGIERAFTRSVSSDAAQASHGIQCAAPNNLCDSVFTKAGIDSLASLSPPVPFTVWCATDSIEAYLYEKNWWTRLPNFKVAPQPAALMGTTIAVNAGNASSTFHVDPFGHYRNRAPISAGRYDNATPCDGIDTTTSCLLTYARSRLDSIPGFGGRQSKALLARYYDYIPNNFSRDNMPVNDPVAMESAMLRAGYTHAVLNVMTVETNASMSWGLSGAGGNVTPNALDPGAPYALTAQSYMRRMRTSNGTTIGDFKWLTTRPHDEANVTDQSGHGHAMVYELENGFLLSNWYQTPNSALPYYYHTFRTRLNVVVIRAGDLGYRTNATSNPVMPGWWLVKHVVNDVRSVNAMCNREVYRIVSVDEL